MLDNEFLESRYSFRVKKEDMKQFLRECEKHDLVWNHGKKAAEFDPIEFYSGDNIQFLAPVQKVTDRNRVYVKCYYGRLYFSFCYDWSMQPMKEYKQLEKSEQALPAL